VSSSRESKTDKKIKVLKEVVEKQGQELKKFRQANKSVRRMCQQITLVRHRLFMHLIHLFLLARHM